jgi:hypothetical protein
MDVTVVLLRLIHILTGVFWAGTLIFFVTFLEPSVRDAGPGGAGVMQGLMRRHYLNIMPIIAGLTILSGADLMRRVSGGFAAEWFGSPLGMTLSVGSGAALVAFVIGVGVMRPAALRVGRLAKAAAETTEPAMQEARQAEIHGLRRRSMLAARWVAAMLTGAVACMAVARYVR